jgi:hypothetical protein
LASLYTTQSILVLSPQPLNLLNCKFPVVIFVTAIEATNRVYYKKSVNPSPQYVRIDCCSANEAKVATRFQTFPARPPQVRHHPPPISYSSQQKNSLIACTRTQCRTLMPRVCRPKCAHQGEGSWRALQMRTKMRRRPQHQPRRLTMKATTRHRNPPKES